MTDIDTTDDTNTKNRQRECEQIAAMLADLDAAQIGPDDEKYRTAARAQLKALHAEAQRDLQRARDACGGLGAVEAKRREAMAEKTRLEAEHNAHVSSGRVDATKVLGFRDAIYVAGMQIAGCDAHSSRLRAENSSKSSAPALAKVRASVRTAREATRGALVAFQAFGPKDADDTAQKHALSMRTEAELGFAIAAEAPVLAECEAKNAEIAKEKTFKKGRHVDPDELRRIFKRRTNAAALQIARGGGEQKMAALLHETRRALDAATATAPTGSHFAELTPEQRREFPEVAALEKKRARKADPAPSGAA